MGNIMIKRNWTSDKEQISAAFKHIKDTEMPIWLISYPEGTRATSNKLKEVTGLLMNEAHLIYYRAKPLRHLADYRFSNTFYFLEQKD
jgi:1-acyl-sn-glycerol-3-phosphate acyltransferase